MLAHDVDKLRITFGRPDGGEVPYGPKAQADQPEAQAEAEFRAEVGPEVATVVALGLEAYAGGYA